MDISRGMQGIAKGVSQQAAPAVELAHSAVAVEPLTTLVLQNAMRFGADASAVKGAEQLVSATADDALAWYKRARIYQINIPTFLDSSGDGVGDFAGVAKKLDYIKDVVHADTIWMMPFNKSPMRDGGYDVSDFKAVNEAYGTIDDFRNLAKEARKRDMHIIADFPLNHTSVDHSWFQRARNAPKGSPERDFYVWSDTDAKFAGTPINFKQFEKSNWTWDPVADQYYWHRWYSHQPDLNWDNPEVVKEMKRVMDFWFDAGVDGLRLDAAPFLIEREGTISQSLPETHAVLKDLRAYVDQRHPGKMLLAEANEAPEKLIKYFGEGSGDEMHMAFDFPLMPRLFQAAATEDVRPIVDIVNQTKDIPRNSQWANFLRNHDELTLEPLAVADRSSMLERYAPDPQSQVLGGIRRRLAPLMDNNPDRVEMMQQVNATLPGTPIVYYGDEIGMGDVIQLRDRDAVRTPMQWTSEPGAGFSTADPSKFPLPLVSEEHYANPVVNVEDQLRDPNSILSRMSRMMKARGENDAFVEGQVRMLDVQDNSILAFVRNSNDDQILAVSNFSGKVKDVTINHGGAFKPNPNVAYSRGAQVVSSNGSSMQLRMQPYAYSWLRDAPMSSG